MSAIPAARHARLFTFLAGIAAIVGAASARPGVRVCTWNITNYAGGRTTDIANVFYGVVPAPLALQGQSMSPDIVTIQEVIGEAAALEIKDILNNAPGSPGDWEMEGFTLGPDTNSAFYYRTSKIENLGSTVAVFGGNLAGAPRHVMRYNWRPIGYASNAATCALFGVHMKAGSTPTDQSRRQVEATAIRNHITNIFLPAFPGAHHSILGDFNINAANEAAYQTMVAPAAGVARVFDPIFSSGTWLDVAVFRFIHTQDPSTSSGMDDRYDQILMSSGLLDGQGLSYIGNPSIAYSNSTWNDPNHSYRAWGNDGTSFNNPLNVSTNSMVGNAIAQDIRDAATPAGGHIPVFADLRVPAIASPNTTTIDFGTVNVGDTAQQNLTVSNGGNVALFGAAGIDTLNYTLTTGPGFTVAGGPFAAVAGAAGNVHVVTMDTSTPGPRNATVVIISDDADNPTRIVNVTGLVTTPPSCPGDVNGDSAVNTADLTVLLGNFGTSVTPNTGGDLDGNGFVNTADLTALLGAFGTIC